MIAGGLSAGQRLDITTNANNANIRIDPHGTGILDAQCSVSILGTLTGATNIPYLASANTFTGQTQTFQKDGTSYQTPLVVSNQNASGNVTFTMASPGAAQIIFNAGNGSFGWSFAAYDSNALQYYSYAAPAGTVMNLYGGANKGTEFFATSTGSHTFKHGGVDRFKVNGTGIGFFNTAPVAQQNPSSTITYYNDGSASTANLEAMINGLYQALINNGLLTGTIGI